MLVFANIEQLLRLGPLDLIGMLAEEKGKVDRRVKVPAARPARYVAELECLVERQGEVFVFQHVKEDRECRLSGTAAAVSPVETVRAVPAEGEAGLREDLNAINVDEVFGAAALSLDAGEFLFHT